jgi:hypothetical protein
MCQGSLMCMDTDESITTTTILYKDSHIHVYTTNIIHILIYVGIYMYIQQTLHVFVGGVEALLSLCTNPEESVTAITSSLWSLRNLLYDNVQAKEQYAYRDGKHICVSILHRYVCVDEYDYIILIYLDPSIHTCIHIYLFCRYTCMCRCIYPRTHISIYINLSTYTGIYVNVYAY